MKLLVIGLGRCGSRIADRFVQLNKKSKIERKVSLLTGAYAVSYDQTSLAQLISKETDSLYRLSVAEPPSEATAEAANLAAELVQAESERILSALRRKEYFETEVFLVIAGAKGNFGSIAAPIVGQKLKERFTGKPVYGLIILPSDSEEAMEAKAVYRTAVCLKSITRVSEAVFLVDNEKLKREGVPLAESWHKANQAIVASFYDFLCASEVSGSKYAGARMLGVGDIIQTLAGLTVIGRAKADLSTRLSFWRLPTFREKGVETLKALEAMNLALSGLSADCDPRDAGKALYLLSAPAKEASIDMAKALGGRLRELTDNAEIRGGDFAGESYSIQVTVVLSQLAYVEKVKNYYDKAVAFLKAERG